jgi:hypothetical protein
MYLHKIENKYKNRPVSNIIVMSTLNQRSWSNDTGI